LLVTRREKGGIAVDRALDTNILVVTVLKFAPRGRSETVEQWRDNFLTSLNDIFIDGTDRRKRWKSIYLIADLVELLHRMNIRDQLNQFLGGSIRAVREFFENGELGPAPFDRRRRVDGLVICDLWKKVEGLANKQDETGEGVYEWSGPENIPCLFLYNSPKSIPYITCWTMFRR